MLRKAIFGLLGLFLFNQAEANDLFPRDSVRLEISKDGKSAKIIHKVEVNETIYAISKRYHVDQKEIMDLNPDIKTLKVGTLIRVPYADYQSGMQLTASKDQALEEKHIVAEGETLYAIARKYQVSVKDIKKWNELESNRISNGQSLVIRKVMDKKPDKETQKEDTIIKTETTTDQKVKVIEHVVQAKETLYALSKKYQVSVEDIKAWNALKGNGLKKGEILKIRVAAEGEKLQSKEEKVEASPKSEEPNEKETSVSISGYEKVVEKGIAELINDTVDNNMFVALHKHAPVGSVIRVQNPINNISVMVRVIGKLPETDMNEKTVIKLSQKAYNRLKASGKRFQVVISYLP